MSQQNGVTLLILTQMEETRNTIAQSVKKWGRLKTKVYPGMALKQLGDASDAMDVLYCGLLMEIGELRKNRLYQ